MDPLVQIIAIILCAKVLGELVERFGFPSLIGEVAAGVVLGPAILNLVSPNEFIEFFADIGIIVLLFMSGAQLNMKTFAKSEKAGIVTGLAGVAFPSAFGVAAGYLVGL
ncbi:MAG TPA: cation:proton antiporter, partial [Methanoregulaceae archaeon]|nr:cation:proton antiporter [Methanoregulaceae archaeon]